MKFCLIHKMFAPFTPMYYWKLVPTTWTNTSTFHISIKKISDIMHVQFQQNTPVIPTEITERKFDAKFMSRPSAYPEIIVELSSLEWTIENLL